MNTPISLANASSYHVPSDTGSVEPGDCQFIWIWYEMLEEDSAEFDEIFTDIAGRRHFTTVPRGKIRPEVWSKRQSRAGAISAPFAELIAKTDDPFVSAIREFTAPGCVFHDGKLLLVGDGFSLFRPHVGASTNQAALQALGLAEVLQGKCSLQDWEKKALEYAKTTSALSAAFGSYSFSGEVPEVLKARIQADRLTQ
jgi:2-polyprenyl-6-methoxyphenol hydroxylase-like FAD-dependent oxidoreductase